MSSSVNSSCCNRHSLSPLFSSDQAPFFFYRIRLPLPPTQSEALRPGLVIGESQTKDTMPISFGTSLGGGQVAALPRETHFRRAWQVSLVPASLRYDLIFQESQPPPRQASQKPSLSRKGRREGPAASPIAHKVRPERIPGFPGGDE